MQILNMATDDYDGGDLLRLSCRGMGLNDADDSREGIARYRRRNPGACFVAARSSAR